MAVEVVLVLVTQTGREREVGPQFPLVLKVERNVSLRHVRSRIAARDRKLRRTAAKHANHRRAQSRACEGERTSITFETAKFNYLGLIIRTEDNLIVRIKPWTRPTRERIRATEVSGGNTVDLHVPQARTDLQKMIARSPRSEVLQLDAIVGV